MPDLKFALRGLAKTPVFTLAAIATLALGIGANTAIFQLIDAVALRPLPVRHPEELVEVRIAGGNQGFGLNNGEYPQLTIPIWQELKNRQQAFAGMFAWGTRETAVGERSDLKRVNGIAVSDEFFRVLGIEALQGRLLGPGDQGPCPASIAVVSYLFWRKYLNGRDVARGSKLLVNLQPVEIVGVTPPGFFGLAVGETFDVAMPLCLPNEPRRDLFNVAVVGRLDGQATLERASAQLDAMSPSLFDVVAPTGYSSESIARFKKFRLAAYSARTGVSALRQQYDSSLRLLLLIAGLVLVIACANLANLMFARGAARRHEVSLRLALGGSKRLIMRPFLIESIVLALAGGLVALGLAAFLSRAMVLGLAGGGNAPDLAFSLDWRVLAFATAVAFGTCVIFGLAPAARATSIEPASALRTGGRGTTFGREQLSLQRWLVGAQVAMSVVMLVAALLLVRSFRNLMSFDAGMRQDGITVAQVGFEPPPSGNSSQSPGRPSPLTDPADHWVEAGRQLLAEIQSVPGVLNAGTTTHVPLVGGSWSHGVDMAGKKGSARFTWVSPGYFSTMNVPILRGRDFALNDTRGSARVAVVNQAFVRALSDRRDPIGLTLRTSPEPGYPATVYEIVGVIPDTQYNNLRGAVPAMVFAPDSQFPAPGPGAQVMIYSNVPPETVIARLRDRIRQRYPEAILDFSVLRARVQNGLVRERMLALIAGFFGVLAVLLTVVGLYGMLSYAVAQRRSEIGVRLALGARPAHIVGLVAREMSWLLAAGIGCGIVTSLLAGRLAASLLFKLTPHDPPTLISASVMLIVIATAAALLPARRASRIDPAQVLKDS